MKTLALITVTTWTALLPNVGSAWTLEPEASTVAFGSIKNDYVGEAHTFGDISGRMDDTGLVTIDIALSSIDTKIDIRNERMLEFVFGSAAHATVSAQIDQTTFDSLAPGASTVVEVDATLSLLGTDTDFYLDMFVMRLSDDRVLASSNAPVYLATEDLGLDAGIDALQGLASLDSITRVTPLTARFVFSK